LVEMQGISSISHWVETGFTVSGVSAVSIMSILSSTISCLATFRGAVRIGLAVLNHDLDVERAAGALDAVLHD
jgi:hypothetical protein